MSVNVVCQVGCGCGASAQALGVMMEAGERTGPYRTEILPDGSVARRYVFTVLEVRLPQGWKDWMYGRHLCPTCSTKEVT